MRFLSFSGQNKGDELLYIFKVIIVSIDSNAVIHYALLFIAFQTIQQLFLPVPAGKFCKSIGFVFLQQALSASIITAETRRNSLFQRAISIIAIYLRALSRLTATASVIFRAQATG